ncbi:Proline dehydrogenase 1 [Diplonema papillatum]|nr:Proline dehydrogenase 1 [Diplonema papillatum]
MNQRGVLAVVGAAAPARVKWRRYGGGFAERAGGGVKGAQTRWQVGTAATPPPAPAAAGFDEQLRKANTSVGADAAAAVPGTEIEKVIDFADAKQAYRSKTRADMWKALVVFRLCTIPPLVRHADKLIKLSESIFGKHMTHGVLVKKTFFSHFCAGENIEEIKPVLSKLQSFGIGAILDYAAENDVPHEERTKDEGGGGIERMDSVLVSRQRADVYSARIYDYAGEAECDANLTTVLQCIEHASQTRDGAAFCAVKLTALCKPALLERMSALLMAIRRSWVEGFATAFVERSTPLEEYRSVVSSPDVSRPINLLQWKRGLARLCKVPVDDDDAEKMFNVLKNDDDFVDYLDFTRLTTLEALSYQFDEDGDFTETSRDLRPFISSGALPSLDEMETKLLKNLVNRISTVAKKAVETGVNVMVDAEQTYLQVAIDHFTLLLQRKFNLEEPRIYNTYQCYLKYSKMRILNDLERSRREGWKFAGKIVRGAYMLQEREIARKKGYASPILTTIDETHRNFDECLQVLLHQMQRRHMGILVGSHNQGSIERILETMRSLGIDKKTGGVYFGQLLGMADHLTFPLGQNGYNVYKYVPYGPVHEVMPYLIRRAQENSSMSALSEQERAMLKAELRRRNSLFK